MIELRFRLEETITCGVESCTLEGCKGVVKILQYRTKNVHIESSTTTPVEPIWSEWTDVPIETP